MNYQEFYFVYKWMLIEAMSRDDRETEDYISFVQRLQDMCDTYPEYELRADLEIASQSNRVD